MPSTSSIKRLFLGSTTIVTKAALFELEIVLEQVLVDADLYRPGVESRATLELQLLVENSMQQAEEQRYVRRTDFRSLNVSHAHNIRDRHAKFGTDFDRAAEAVGALRELWATGYGLSSIDVNVVIVEVPSLRLAPLGP